jgi:guanyl-specific ribonuclease Sa
MFKSYGRLIAGILIGLAAGLLLGRQFFSGNQTIPGSVPVAGQGQKQPVGPASPGLSDNSQRDHGIPQKVYNVLNYIRSNHQPMPGYTGGRIFSNREELLPREDNNGKPILYHEWDVNPKIEGQNRGTERIITGSDGRAWYTNDHYRSFREIK